MQDRAYPQAMASKVSMLHRVYRANTTPQTRWPSAATGSQEQHNQHRPIAPSPFFFLTFLFRFCELLGDLAQIDAGKRTMEARSV